MSKPKRLFDRKYAFTKEARLLTSDIDGAIEVFVSNASASGFDLRDLHNILNSLVTDAVLTAILLKR